MRSGTGGENHRFSLDFGDFRSTLKSPSGWTTATRDLKIFLVVARNMPDAVAKFGGDPLARFRDLELTKNVIFQK